MGREGSYCKPRVGGQLGPGQGIQKAYNVTSGGVGSLFDFTQPPRAVEGVIPDRGPDR